MHLFWSDNDDNVKDNDDNENDEKDDEKKMRKKKGDNLFSDAPAVTQLSAAEHCSVFTAFKLLIRKCQPSLPRCNKYKIFKKKTFYEQKYFYF